MNKRLTWMMSAVVTAAAFSAAADGWAVFDGGWRISAGAVYNFNAKASCRVAPRQGYVSPFRAGLSKSEAEARASGTKTSATRTDFGNGAWIDTDDPVCKEGDLPGKTRYYMFPRGTWNGSQTFTLGSAEYSEVDIFRPAEGAFDRSFSDESGMLGVNVELSRNLYHNEDWGWGVDAAIGFTYFRHNKLLRCGSRWLNGSSTHSYGRRSSSLTIDGARGQYSDFNWSGDGSFYGSGGTKTGPGTYVDDEGNEAYAGPISFNDDPDLFGDDYSESDASYGSMSADGDYENMEILMLARPYYDVFEWLRINAIAGVVVSRQEFDLTFSLYRDGAREYHSRRDYDQWDVYGVAGLGMQFYYKDFTLGFDFLARFLDRDLDYHDRYVDGSVERGTWMFRLMLGYEF